MELQESDILTSKLKKLLTSDDPSLINEGLEMVLALNQSEIWEGLLAGLIYDPRMGVLKASGLNETVSLRLYASCPDRERFLPIQSVTQIRLVPDSFYLLPELQSILLNPVYSIDDLRSLSDFFTIPSADQVKHLNLSFSSNSLMHTLLDCEYPALESLCLCNNNGITDFNFLTGFSGLKKLEMMYLAYEFKDLTFLASLTALEELYLDDLEYIQDLSPLSGLKNLRILRIGNCIQVTDIGPISFLAGLEELDLSGSVHITSLKALLPLRKLKCVNIISCDGLLEHGWKEADLNSYDDRDLMQSFKRKLRRKYKDLSV
jgi:Leucine-rich repeat (LRR) protein